MDGVQFTSATDCAVLESKEAACCIKEQCDVSQDEHCHAQLDMHQHLQDPGPMFTTSPPPTVDLKATLVNMPFANEEEISFLNEALATFLTFPLVNAEFLLDPVTLHEALSSSDASDWCASIEKELKSLLDMGVYKLVLHSSVPAGCKVLHGKWVFRLK